VIAAAARDPRAVVSSASSSARVQLSIASMTVEDWPAVARIYEAGIAGGNATFELKAPDWEEWCRAHVDDPSLVARGPSGDVLGWAALGPVSARAVYRGVAEVSIYVDPRHVGRGVGRVLLSALIEASEQAGFWTLDAGIFPENAASIALHEACGFTLMGVRTRVGRMSDGRWRDVWMYQRRSAIVGQD
jgi:L-amino acid N-acyltransferase YncA